jgi:hypothetical protein
MCKPAMLNQAHQKDDEDDEYNDRSKPSQALYAAGSVSLDCEGVGHGLVNVCGMGVDVAEAHGRRDWLAAE